MFVSLRGFLLQKIKNGGYHGNGSWETVAVVTDCEH